METCMTQRIGTLGFAAALSSQPPGLGLSTVNQGSARILTTTSSKATEQILCTAFLATAGGNPPSVMTESRADAPAAHLPALEACLPQPSRP